MLGRTDQTLLRNTLLLFLTLSGSACTTVMYGGPRRDSNQVAIIATASNSRLESLDGHRVEGGSFAKYEVLPGKHSVDIVSQTSENHVFYTRFFTSRPLTACFFARAGRTYEVRSYPEEDHWEREIVSDDLGTDVKFDCSERPSRPATTPAPQAASTPQIGDAPQPASEPQPGASPQPALARPQRRKSPALPEEPKPGTGFHLGMAGSFGGDDLATAVYENGETRSLSAGEGLSLYFGGTVTPFWINDTAGFGFGGNIGWKYNSIDASNGSISFSRVPLVLSLQTLVKLTEHGYLSAAGGVHKEFSAQVSGSGVVSGQANLQSPMGWMAELGGYVVSTWHFAYGFALRFTQVHYTIGDQTFDGSNVGFHLTLHINP